MLHLGVIIAAVLLRSGSERRDNEGDDGQQCAEAHDELLVRGTRPR
jgi:hypothetical protein